MVATRASSSRCALRRQTAFRPSRMHAEWSAVRNSTWPLIAATRCHLMTQDTVQFSGAASFGYGKASPACFTDRQVTPRSDATSHNTSKITGKNVSHSDLSTGPKASPMPGVTLCTNAHSCWSDFCSPT